MKYTKLFFAAMALAMTTTVSAQGFRVYTKAGIVINYPANTVERIEFYPADETPGPNPPVTPSTASEEKNFLEQTGIALLNEIKANDFHDIVELTNRFGDIRDGVMDEWVDDCAAAMKTVLSTHDETETDNWGSTVYHYTDYKWMLRASTFTGHFKEVNNTWTKEGTASDLQFTFSDKNGNTCVARLTTSGNTKTVHIFDEEEHGRYYNGMYQMDNNLYYLDVPEHLMFTLTRNGMALVTVNVDIDLSSINSEEWDLTRDGATVDVLAQVNDYIINFNKTGYKPGTGATVNFALSKNGTSLVSANVSAAGTLNINSQNIYDDPEIDSEKLGVANTVFDVMGRLQVRSQISSIGNLIKQMNRAYENDSKESDFKRYVNNANGLMENKFYFSNESSARGSISLEAFLDDEWNGKEYWDMRPVITFNSDGTSYAFDTYFTEKGFQSLVDTYKNLLDDFNDMIESAVE